MVRQPNVVVNLVSWEVFELLLDFVATESASLEDGPGWFPP